MGPPLVPVSDILQDIADVLLLTKMLQINNKNFIQYEVNGTTVYEIQDFYKYPDKVIEFISNIIPYLHKGHEQPSYNGRAFEDLRHSVPVRGLWEVCNFLSSICNQHACDPHSLKTNMFKFLDSNFDQHDQNYWWPHIDDGYTALVYLNNFSYPGTNLYNSSNVKLLNKGEHFTPWQPKSNWKLETTLQAEYNKLVLFDGLNNPHSMSISDNLFFDQYRLNQVIFFQACLAQR